MFRMFRPNRRMFRILHAKGVAETTGGVYAMPSQPTTVHPFENTDPPLLYDGSPPEASDRPLLSIRRMQRRSG